MKTTILLIASLFFVTFSFCQTKALKITNPNTIKEVIILEHKRVRIKTTEGKKVSGKVRFGENNNLIIKGKEYALTDIEKIKRNPLGLSLLSSTGMVLLSITTLTVMTSLALFSGGGDGLALLFVPAAGFVYLAFKAPNVLKSYTASSGWTYQIIIVNNQ